MSTEVAAGQPKRRTFKKFSFRDVDLDSLLDMSTDELGKLFNACARRSGNIGVEFNRKSYSRCPKLSYCCCESPGERGIVLYREMAAGMNSAFPYAFAQFIHYDDDANRLVVEYWYCISCYKGVCWCFVSSTTILSDKKLSEIALRNLPLPILKDGAGLSIFLDD
ncbi:Ribosomal protein S19 family protein [Perilla frutescens var. hirtella]|nr:Ribosomal protein S19 family protein [Perilla frutescens var. frutescens]KAH6787612.1 Ribosomal protein S19 family protein [Perilla frutescens var. hirtella]